MDIKTQLQHTPEVKGFFDPRTFTISYVVADPKTKHCAIIDSVVDFNLESGSLTYTGADAMIGYVTDQGYTVQWILETHMHADHLSAAPYLKNKLGGKSAIGEHVNDVLSLYSNAFNSGADYDSELAAFDELWKDGDTFSIGTIPVTVWYTPGHTPADVVYIIGDAVFAGDTMFMPDFGSARCDFPGGSADSLFDNRTRLFTLPEEMRMFMCHDYLPEGRTEYQWETTIGAQKRGNIHLKEGVQKTDFVSMRNARDKTLSIPKLMIPSIQVNIRAGALPPAESDGNQYLKIPINGIFSTVRKNKN